MADERVHRLNAMILDLLRHFRDYHNEECPAFKTYGDADCLCGSNELIARAETVLQMEDKLMTKQDFYEICREALKPMNRDMSDASLDMTIDIIMKVVKNRIEMAEAAPSLVKNVIRAVAYEEVRQALALVEDE